MNRSLLRLFTAAVLAVMSFASSAQGWPARSVRMIVPFAAGGATDVVARLLAQKLSEVWGQSVVVENRLGAGGNIGADVVAKSPPDGYTLLLASGAIVSAPYMYKATPFDVVKDFAPVINVATGPQVIAVSNAMPAKDLKELIAMAKAQPKSVNFGSAGVGSQTHLAAENFAYSAGIDLTHVPYKGESAAITDLIGGQIQLVTPNLGGAIALIQQGKIRALAVTSRERNAQLPDVPSASEVLPGFENAGWFGILAPAGTPREVVDRIHRDSAKIALSEEFAAKLALQGMVPVANTPAQFSAAIRDENVRWARIIRERGLAAN